MMGRSVWRPQIDALSERFRCISVDLPGHGAAARAALHARRWRSRRSRGRSTREAGGRAVLVGLSLGGYTSRCRGRAASRAGPRPGRRRLDARAGRPQPARRSSSTAGSCGSRRSGLVRAVALALVPAALRHARRRTAITAGGHFARGGCARRAGLAEGASASRSRRTAARSSSSTARCDLVFRVGAERFLEGRPQGHRRMIPRAGHLSNVDQPEAFTGLVEEFIGSLERRHVSRRTAVPRDPVVSSAAGPSRSGPIPVRFDARPKGGVPGCRLGNALPAGDEGPAEGDAARSSTSRSSSTASKRPSPPASSRSSSSPRRHKGAIEDHFDLNFELEQVLEEKGEIEKLRQVRRDQRPRPARVRPPEGAARPRPRDPDGEGPHRPRAVRGAAAR